jgi:putative flippase GtrA
MRFASFVSVNAVLVCLNLAIAWLCTDVLTLHYMWGASAGYGIQVVLGFFIQRDHIFRRSDITTTHGLIRACLVECISVGVMIGTTLVFVEWFSMWHIYARMCSMLCVGAWDYVAHSYFTFRTHPFR